MEGGGRRKGGIDQEKRRIVAMFFCGSNFAAKPLRETTPPHSIPLKSIILLSLLTPLGQPCFWLRPQFMRLRLGSESSFAPLLHAERQLVCPTMAASQPVKLCFVTVGATASFHLLLQAVLDQPFWDALHRAGYTHLLVQYGKDGKSLFEECLGKTPNQHGINIKGFDFNREGLEEEMGLAQSSPSEHRSGGMIISHAGKDLCGLLPFSFSPSIYKLRREPAQGSFVHAQVKEHN